jgi:hypothetical protein
VLSRGKGTPLTGIALSCLLAACGGDGSSDADATPTPAIDAGAQPVDAGGTAADAGGVAADGGGSAVKCTVEPPTSCPADPPDYTNDIEPIIRERCTLCHDGKGEEWSLTTYEHVADWYDLIPPEVAHCRMPPPDAGVPITDEERVEILTWFVCGFPE